MTVNGNHDDDEIKEESLCQENIEEEEVWKKALEEKK